MTEYLYARSTSREVCEDKIPTPYFRGIVRPVRPESQIGGDARIGMLYEGETLRKEPRCYLRTLQVSVLEFSGFALAKSLLSATLHLYTADLKKQRHGDGRMWFALIARKELRPQRATSAEELCRE